MKKKIKKKIKNLPFCYVLSKTSIEKTLWVYDNLTSHSWEKRNFYKKTGYRLNLTRPRSFNEKIVWKKLYDRNPLLTMTADKYMVRKYVKEKLGKEKAQEILIPLLYVTDRPETIPFYELPEDFVVKANHGSGTNSIVRDGKFRWKDLIKECRKWLKIPYGLSKNEWAYSKIDRKIIVEKFICDEEGKIPKDYKFYIFHGKCRLIHIDFDRYEEHKRSLFDSEWKHLPATLKFPAGKVERKPANFQKMRKLAERLGAGFNFVRVDLFSCKKKIYFGEITHYPESGYGKFSPRSFDFELGKNWEIKQRYWEKDS